MTKLNWFCKEYIGSEIMLVPRELADRDPKTLTTDEVAQLRGNIELFKSGWNAFRVPLPAIEVGTVILAPTILGDYAWAIVDHVEGDSAMAKSRDGRMAYFLEFGRDDRNCWVCTGAGNLAGLKRLKLFRPDEEDG